MSCRYNLKAFKEVQSTFKVDVIGRIPHCHEGWMAGIYDVGLSEKDIREITYEPHFKSSMN